MDIKLLLVSSNKFLFGGILSLRVLVAMIFSPLNLKNTKFHQIINKNLLTSNIKLNYLLFKKRIDRETGSILYYRDDIKGLPEKVIEGNGFTVEIKSNQVYLIDIFNAEKVLHTLLKTVKDKAA